jgi:hypothetical protein
MAAVAAAVASRQHRPGDVGHAVAVAPTDRRRRRLDPRTLLVSAGFAVGVLLVAHAFTSARTGSAGQGVNNPAIDRLIPSPDDLVLRQSEVGIDLATGYTGQLIIDGQALPTQEVVAAGSPNPGTVDRILNVRFDRAENTLLYQPLDLPGAPIKQFDPGQHTITARFWKLDEGEDTAHQYTWTFRAA